MNFEATLKITLSNVIDPETFNDVYKNNARSMLLGVFDGPMDMVANADEVLLVEARPVKEEV